MVVEMFISRSSGVALLAISSAIKSKCNFARQTMRIHELRSHSKNGPRVSSLRRVVDKRAV